jgi:hypothetical protein
LQCAEYHPVWLPSSQLEAPSHGTWCTDPVHLCTFHTGKLFKVLQAIKVNVYPAEADPVTNQVANPRVGHIEAFGAGTRSTAHVKVVKGVAYGRLCSHVLRS